MNPSRILLLAIIAVAITVFFAVGGHHYLTLDMLKTQQDSLFAYRDAHRQLTIALYGLIYIIVTGLSLPGATVMTLAGGALFGLLWGTVIVSFASTMGATLAFLAARFLFREQIQARFGDRLKTINEGMAKDGAFYLFTLRLVPLFPFFIINLVMGLTAINTRTFYAVSQIGMLAGTLVYVNAGTQLAQLDSLAGILSPTLIGSFALLGVFPFITKKILELLLARKIYSAWPKPHQFDNNLVVIGAGAGGLVASYIAAAVKAKVTLIEKHRMGGDCLYTGCVPSKTLICSAKAAAQIRRSGEFGIHTSLPEVDFAAVMARVKAVIKAIEPHDSPERYTDLGVDVAYGTAKILSPWEVEVSSGNGTRVITTRAIVIATGAKPFVPAIPGLAEIGYLTSDTIWDLSEKPQRLLVLGGGPIGCELAQAFARLGCQVTQIEILPRLLAREDSEVSALVLSKFRQEGISVLLAHEAKEFVSEQGENILIAEHQGQAIHIAFDQVLVALGRSANVSGFGAQALGIDLSAKNTIAIDGFQATNYPNIYACGDVAGPYQFTHTAAHQAWYASVNALFGQVKKFRTDYSAIPQATFIEPEVARVGLNEQEAREQGIVYETSTYALNELDRAIADAATQGFVKVLTRPGTDKILGVTIVGEQASELIAEFVLAMKHNLGLNKILGTIHIYPTLAEANKYTAGVWKRQHAPQRVLKCLATYHRWLRH
ncbi:MAG: FAD-dependent oxidoreductase [Methylovulum sp.]|uniref:FAD-dependent oxidoreductase n=1 Tax=Methylovulum sp. TaxID=1916980 RepID=UPI002625A90F|nr:bifunctional TVP38/TMEM64 family protein/FAD-dependent oxidoreductase [Methylovulum sp.]MDD2722899.1 FAD-dependent oxidoreductase [Methylovulum sp.]MDD5124856.1 FAD-dependent oxidoreductase [Methylovulum sp.]